MLVLSRKQNQNIVIDGQIVIKVVRLDKDVVKLGIEAPSSISVHRQEVFDEIERCNKNALQSGPRSMPQLNERVKDPTET